MPFAIAGLGLAGLGAIGSGLSAANTKSGLQAAANTPYVDPNAVYNTSLQATSNALPQAQSLTGQENAFNTAQMQQALNASIPGYAAIQGARSNNIQSELAGNLPPDVQAAIARASAAQGLGGGFGGSQAGGNLTARDLGLTSLQLMQQGGQQAQQLISGTPLMAPASVASNLGITPEAVYGADVTQRGQNLGIAAQAAMAPGALGALGGIGQTAGGALFTGGGGVNSLQGLFSGGSANTPEIYG